MLQVSARWSLLRPPLLQVAAVLTLLAVAIALRSARFDDPLFGLDEQFYAVAGHRLLDGAVPYVDVFDRKPFGLFALFAGLATLGGDPLLIAKLAATLAAATGAVFVTSLAAPAVSKTGALLAGIWYLVLIGALGGSVAQAPVFYNPLTAAAALLALRTAPALTGLEDRRRAIGAMLLAGLAVQMKTTAIFEGAAIGGWLLVRLVGARVAWKARASMLIVAAALPTLAVAAGFASFGLGRHWWFATVEAQGLKSGAWDAASLARLPILPAGLTAPLLLAVIGAWLGPRTGRRALLLAWAGASLIETVSIGQFHFHYALPFAAPAAVLAAPLFGVRFAGPLALAVVAALPVRAEVFDARAEAVTARAAFRDVSAALPADVGRSCLFVYGAPMSYYLVRHACVTTPYLFIDQLDAQPEAQALPIEADRALALALARRPGTILTIPHPAWAERNRRNDALIADVLARDYQVITTIPHGWGAADPSPLTVWRRIAR